MNNTQEPVVHQFRERLAFSEAAGHEPFWEAVYRKAFPNYVNSMPCTGDTTSQRMGVDRVIHLSNGKTLYVDEKKRGKIYGDILLEYLSNDRTNAPGWIEKDLSIDYLAYAFMPNQKVYLFPWLLLRRAWIENRDSWHGFAKRNYGGFSYRQARNPGYYTHNMAVPMNQLFNAVNRASVIEVSVNA